MEVVVRILCKWIMLMGAITDQEVFQENWFYLLWGEYWRTR